MDQRSKASQQSPTPVTIYHNPRCSKSRGALQILRDRGIEPTVVEYLQNPPNAKTLDHVLQLAGVEPCDAMRKQEKEYKDLGLDNPKLTRAQLIAAMVEHPVLIERPIVVRGNRAVIARPPERVEEIL
jgi:arsenate reductase